MGGIHAENLNDVQGLKLNDLYKMIYVGNTNEEVMKSFNQQLMLLIYKMTASYRKDYKNVDELVDACRFEIIVAMQEKKIDIKQEKYSFTGYCLTIIHSNCCKYYKRIKNDWDMIAFSLDEEIESTDKNISRHDIVGGKPKDKNMEILEVVLLELSKETNENPAITWFLKNKIGGFSNIEIAKEAHVSDSYVSREINKVFKRVKAECMKAL
ncbi:MAG: hypothetical protein RSC10_00530 [Longicatena sp.]